MSFNVIFEGEKLEVANFSFDSENKYFISDGKNKINFALRIFTPFELKQEFVEDNFLVCFLIKKGVAESEIVELKDKNRNKRIGLFIPVMALSSADHGEANKTYFCNYAHIALKLGLNSIPDNAYKIVPVLADDRPLTLIDILHESTVFLVISCNNLDGEFDFMRWIPGLAAQGYFPLTSNNPENMQVKSTRHDGNKINISPVSKDVENIQYLSEVYYNAYPYEKKAVFQFFYLYQIIEFLMELVFQCEQQAVVLKLLAAQRDLNGIKDAMENAFDHASEKKRMKLLIGGYSESNADLSSLIDECNKLLIQLGQKEGLTLEATLYPTRNFLFHQFRNFPIHAEEKLKIVVKQFLDFLPTLLAKFKKP